MIHLPQIWDLLQLHMNTDAWYPIETIYQMIEEHYQLDDEDFEPQAPTSSIPKWKRNVRNVLQYRKTKGDLLWDVYGNYKIGNMK